MISKSVEKMLKELDYQKRYYYNNICLRWKNKNTIVACDYREDKYVLGRYNIKNYTLKELQKQVESDCVISLVFGSGVIYE